MIGMRQSFRISALIAALLSLLITGAAPGATITVNSLADPGAPGICALRDAIAASNTKTATNGCSAGSGNDIIDFDVKGTISLENPLPTVRDQLSISGPASPGITIDGGSKVRMVQVALHATLNLKDLTIANCLSDLAGAILNNGILRITNSRVSGNRGFSSEYLSLGGAIVNYGKLMIANSTFSGNSADTAGGIYNKEAATLTVINSSFSGNSATYSGGGIYNYGTLTVTDSTF